MIRLDLCALNDIAAQAGDLKSYTTVISEKSSEELAPGILLFHSINGKFNLISLDPLLQSYNVSGEIAKNYSLNMTLTSLEGEALSCRITKKANTLVAYIDYLI